MTNSYIDNIAIFIKEWVEGTEVNRLCEEIYIFGSLVEGNFLPKISDLDVLFLMSEHVKSPAKRCDLILKLQSNKFILEKKLSTFLERNSTEDIVDLTAITRFEFNEDIGFPKSPVPYNGKKALRISDGSVLTIKNNPQILNDSLNHIVIQKIKIIIGSVQQFRTKLAAININREKKVLDWSPNQNKEKTLINKELSRLAAMLFYTLANANDPEKSRQSPSESFEQSRGAFVILKWLTETIDNIPLNQSSANKSISNLLNKMLASAFTPDRAIDYVLTPWEQAILHEVIWQVAVDWLKCQLQPNNLKIKKTENNRNTADKKFSSTNEAPLNNLKEISPHSSGSIDFLDSFRCDPISVRRYFRNKNHHSPVKICWPSTTMKVLGFPKTELERINTADNDDILNKMSVKDLLSHDDCVRSVLQTISLVNNRLPRRLAIVYKEMESYFSSGSAEAGICNILSFVNMMILQKTAHVTRIDDAKLLPNNVREKMTTKHKEAVSYFLNTTDKLCWFRTKEVGGTKLANFIYVYGTRQTLTQVSKSYREGNGTILLCNWFTTEFIPQIEWGIVSNQDFDENIAVKYNESLVVDRFYDESWREVFWYD